jgi:lipopolysaccharide transport system ATP-binding protein
MNDAVIRAESLGKKYLIGHHANGGERYTTMREALASGARGIAHLAAGVLQGRQMVDGDEVEEFWALKNVSFEVKRGEVMGIIGRNGAGKSTLLKILSRITEPSAGRVTIKGRVASLLEVGTGFHPELSGRENIYLNGAILGLSRAEIRRKFDEIVTFADVERFLDTPVKRFSSGMYVRLAFAVAAHLESEILVIDEVLAVGDVEFQRKCLRKMGDIAGKSGRTVLFVSHHLPAISGLCNSVIELANGTLSFQGNTAEGVARYLASTRAGAASSEYRPLSNTGDLARLESARLVDEWGQPTNVFRQDQEIRLEITVAMLSASHAFRLVTRLHAADGTVLLSSSPADIAGICPVGPGMHVYTCRIPMHFLNTGIFSVSIAADLPMQNVLFFHENALTFEVLDLGGLQSEIPDKRLGFLRCRLDWCGPMSPDERGSKHVAGSPAAPNALFSGR